MMKQNKMEEQWLNEICQTLADHEEELPADGWEKLAAAMGGVEEVEPAVLVRQPHVSWVWLQRAAAVFLLGAIGLGGMYYFSDSPEILNNPMASAEKESLNAEESYTEETSFVQDQISTQIEIPSTLPILARNSASVSYVEPAIAQESETKEITIPEETVVDQPQQTIQEPMADIHQEEQAILLAMDEAPAKKHAASRSWTVGMRFARNGLSNAGSEDIMSNLNGPYDSPIANPTPADSAQENSMTRALTRASKESSLDEVISSENYLSWSVGITVGKPLNRCLSLESGLVYTYLSADVTMKQAGRQHQQLHYLGIPLKLSAAIVEEGHWRFYASMGTMLEHSLYGKRGTKNLHLNDWQWSMDGGLGLQYKLTDYMGLYVEPGLNYYFSNGSEVPSLRTERPFSFKLQIGIRLGL